MSLFWQDLRYGVRALRAKPGFAAVAILTLALGIGVNSAIFGVVNALLLRDLPFQDPNRLVLLWQTNPKSTFPEIPFSFPNFTDLKDQSQSFSAVGAWNSSIDTRFNLTGDPEPEQVQAAFVSSSFFSILGVKPAIGRSLLPEEDVEGGPRSVVISHRLWVQRLGSDPQLVGKPLTLDGNSYTVVGVMPAGFAFPKFPKAADLWLALSRDPDPTQFRKYARGATFLSVIGRLKPGVSFEEARAEARTIAGRLEQEYPHFNTGLGIELATLPQRAVGDLRQGLLILLGAVGFVLLIACANVANLLLARATSRQREIAIRMALGASRMRMIRQLLTESLLLSATGGTLGSLLAMWGVDLVAALPYNAPSPVVPYTTSPNQVHLDGTVLVFTFGLSLLTALIFGLIPALQSSKPDLTNALKEGGTGSGDGWRRHRVRSLLVVSEIALSVVLLIGAGLMIKSFLRLTRTDPGFEAERVQSAEINLPRSRYPTDEQVASFYHQVLEKLRSAAGVRSAGAVSALPLTGTDSGSDFFIEGQPPPPPEKKNETNYRTISPDYFDALSIPLLEGRFFNEYDNKRGKLVAIVNETMARHFWPGEDAVGKRVALSIEALKFPFPNRPPVFDIPGAMREIVGIVKDVRHNGLDHEPQPEMFIPYIQRPARQMSLVVSGLRDAQSLAATLRQQVTAVDKDQAMANVATMSGLLSDSVARPRFNFLLLGIFAGVALALAAIGVYGVMSYAVSRRTREIGIRVALGANRGDVLRMVVREGMLLTAAGVVTGGAAALALTRVMQSLLFGVSPTDPATFAAIPLLLIGVALAACWIPARRAMRVDPMVALRYE